MPRAYVRRPRADPATALGTFAGTAGRDDRWGRPVGTTAGDGRSGRPLGTAGRDDRWGRPVGTAAGDGGPGLSVSAPTVPPMVAALSPSRASDFMQCPLLYRFRVIDKLPQAPSAAAARGTLVH